MKRGSEVVSGRWEPYTGSIVVAERSMLYYQDVHSSKAAYVQCVNKLC